ncbi:hypothetical protein [Actinorugispora endophytica]|uniref:Signal recognition particle receptor subunit beta n=1 Tax=Actinorugispora endophytica TaxID=1605990 RepID=A0A4R6V5Z3_9ACTN|nr:hypothetical protein [Actinorugispora endophytica]TDQ54401.1 signal recognition particle receptor subunit beta [Actinorugispora endophytica]
MPSPVFDGSLTSVKVLVTGAPGAGKSTLVAALSDSPPLLVADLVYSADGLAEMSVSSWPGAFAAGAVVMNVGRRILPDGLVLALVGAPSAPWTDPMWDEALRDAAAAIVLAHPREVAAAYEHIALLEERGVPFVVAVSMVAGIPLPSSSAVRELLELASAVPVILCDLRLRASGVGLLRDALRVARDRLPALPPAMDDGHEGGRS